MSVDREIGGVRMDASGASSKRCRLSEFVGPACDCPHPRASCGESNGDGASDTGARASDDTSTVVEDRGGPIRCLSGRCSHEPPQRCLGDNREDPSAANAFAAPSISTYGSPVCMEMSTRVREPSHFEQHSPLACRFSDWVLSQRVDAEPAEAALSELSQCEPSALKDQTFRIGEL